MPVSRQFGTLVLPAFKTPRYGDLNKPFFLHAANFLNKSRHPRRHHKKIPHKPFIHAVYGSPLLRHRRPTA